MLILVRLCKDAILKRKMKKLSTDYFEMGKRRVLEFGGGK
jgi:hypothetical protein